MIYIQDTGGGRGGVGIGIRRDREWRARYISDGGRASDVGSGGDDQLQITARSAVTAVDVPQVPFAFLTQIGCGSFG
jgi:hypothetical protein